MNVSIDLSGLSIRLDVFLHTPPDDPPPKWATELKAMLTTITQKEIAMGVELDNLTAQVTASTTVQDSAMVLLTGLKSALDAAIAAGNPAALQALSDSLGAESSKMAAAITANTPAATGGGGPTPAAAARR